MPHDLVAATWWGPVATLLQVLMIDLVLAGDNAVAVGVAAAGLEEKSRRRVILLGLIAAVVIRIALALFAIQLLNLIGLMLAGGLLLLWVAWKMWRETHAQIRAGHSQTEKPAKSFGQAFLQILIADLSMSLDNVLAIAGAAREHPAIMVFGLLLSIALMGVAAHGLSRILHRMPWIAFVGIAIVVYVSLHMVWEGYRDMVIDTHTVGAHNSMVPSWLDIKPGEITKHRNPH